MKVYGDAQVVAVGDGQFVSEAWEGMNGMVLDDVEAFVSTASAAGDIEVQIRNVTQAVDMLSDPIVIEDGELNSKDAASQPVIDTANAVVAWGDHVAIDVDAAGANATGLGVKLIFV